MQSRKISIELSTANLQNRREKIVRLKEINTTSFSFTRDHTLYDGRLWVQIECKTDGLPLEAHDIFDKIYVTYSGGPVLWSITRDGLNFYRLFKVPFAKHPAYDEMTRFTKETVMYLPIPFDVTLAFMTFPYTDLIVEFFVDQRFQVSLTPYMAVTELPLEIERHFTMVPYQIPFASQEQRRYALGMSNPYYASLKGVCEFGDISEIAFSVKDRNGKYLTDVISEWELKNGNEVVTSSGGDALLYNYYGCDTPVTDMFYIDISRFNLIRPNLSLEIEFKAEMKDCELVVILIEKRAMQVIEGLIGLVPKSKK